MAMHTPVEHLYVGELIVITVMITKLICFLLGLVMHMALFVNILIPYHKVYMPM